MSKEPTYPCLRKMPLDKIEPYPNNPRSVSPERLAQLNRQLSDLGNLQPMTYNVQTKRLISGNQRLKIYQERGDKKADVWCVDLPEAKERIAVIALNNHAGEFDAENLKMLTELIANSSEDGIEDLDLAGFKPGELEALIAAAHEDETTGGGAPKLDVVLFTQDQIIDEAFKFYRQKGFPYRNLPLHVCMQQINALANTPKDALINTDMGYHVADTFHPHRFKGFAEGMKSPYDSFHDDKLLRKALRLTYENAGRIGIDYISLLSLVEGTQACSNFRPGFALLHYREFCKPGDTVLDTSTGYGGRLLGFIASGLGGKYIGIDPSTKTHEGNLVMAAALGFEKNITLINQPAEDVNTDALSECVDFAFTSPPYFTKERYADEDTQSFARYPTIDTWVQGFLIPMLKLQFKCLKPGAHNVINIADVQIGKEMFPLADLCEQTATACGFEFVEHRKYPLSGHKFGANLEELQNTEPVFVFRKPA